MENIDREATVIIMVILTTYYISPLVNNCMETGAWYYNCCADYNSYKCIAMDLGGITIYVPETGDQIGYSDFPSTPYSDTVENIELRSGKVLGDSE